MVEQANTRLPIRNGTGGLRSAKGALGSANVAAMDANFGSRDADEDFAPACVFRFVSCLLLGHGVGAFHAPGGTARLCFSGFQKIFLQRARKTFSEPSENAPLGAWEHGPLAIS
jgi:hypothetical protein